MVVFSEIINLSAAYKRSIFIRSYPQKKRMPLTDDEIWVIARWTESISKQIWRKNE